MIKLLETNTFLGDLSLYTDIITISKIPDYKERISEISKNFLSNLKNIITKKRPLVSSSSGPPSKKIKSETDDDL